MASNFIWFVYLSRCTVYVNHFVASGCPVHLLFLEIFEYHQRSMILLCPIFRYLYQLYVLGTGRGPTLKIGVPDL